VVIPVDRAFVMEALDISRPPPSDDDGDDDSNNKPAGAAAGAAGAAAAAASAAFAAVSPARVLRYKQVEGAFSNPNGHVAVHTLRWLCARADAILQERQESSSLSSSSSGPSSCDLLELYCGYGFSGRWRGFVVGYEKRGGGRSIIRPFIHSRTYTANKQQNRNGNHTMALARKFRRVVGVEINKHLVQVRFGGREGKKGITNETPYSILQGSQSPDC
jgi:hypothetical protein